MTDEAVEEKNPFTPDNAPGVQLIVQMRIYDVLLAILTDMAPDRAKALMELHAQGILMGSAPGFENRFITDEVNKLQQ